MLKSVGEQTLMVLEDKNIPTVAEERLVLLDGGKSVLGRKGRKVIVTRLSQSCSIIEWRNVIAARIGANSDSFELRTRTCAISAKNTIRSYGVSPESIVYVMKYLLVCYTFLYGSLPIYWIMSESYSVQPKEDDDYLPQNDEFIPPTNFAVIEKGLYRSIQYSSLLNVGAFPVKRNFPFLKHLGIRSILYGLHFFFTYYL